MTIIPNCCPWMESMLATAGEQGLGLVAFWDGDFRRFEIQARAFTPAQDIALVEMLRTETRDGPLRPLFTGDRGNLIPIVSVVYLPIAYCPHCGKDLKKHINRHRRDFDRLAEKQAGLARR